MRIFSFKTFQNKANEASVQYKSNIFKSLLVFFFKIMCIDMYLDFNYKHQGMHTLCRVYPNFVYIQYQVF